MQCFLCACDYVKSNSDVLIGETNVGAFKENDYNHGNWDI